MQWQYLDAEFWISHVGRVALKRAPGDSEEIDGATRRSLQVTKFVTCIEKLQVTMFVMYIANYMWSESKCACARACACGFMCIDAYACVGVLCVCSTYVYSYHCLHAG